VFRCGICHALSQPREKSVLVVLLRERIIHPEKGNPGTRIVNEVLAHEPCSIAHALTLLAEGGDQVAESLKQVSDSFHKVSDAFTLNRKRELSD